MCATDSACCSVDNAWLRNERKKKEEAEKVRQSAYALAASTKAAEEPEEDFVGYSIDNKLNSQLDVSVKEVMTQDQQLATRKRQRSAAVSGEWKKTCQDRVVCLLIVRLG